ncbi:MAG TPA: lactate racemase domain-containing protein [Pyrinomonadaceae bacterium]|nr:lactate racemase domain-containing protein [Pyrinomonadaceae bacterium]
MKNGSQKEPHGFGSPDADLTAADLRGIVAAALADARRDSRVLAIISDKTRDDNTHTLFPFAAEVLSEKGAAKFDALVAQGTHSPMTSDEKLKKIGADNAAFEFSGQIFDHRWDRPDELVRIGELSANAVAEITGGLFNEPIELTINHLLAPGIYDLILVFGATVPHEVAGFAGGAKYFFPGVAGAELTHKTHWLAALATIEKIIGRVETPTRHLIEAAADQISPRIISFTSVVSRTDDNRLRTHALFAGDFRLALRRGADVSRHVHIKYTGRKFKRVIALLDEHYDDLWVGGKASYRLGAVIEEGGELIIYAPRLRCISDTHGEAIEKFGGYAPIEKIKDLVAVSGELQSNLCVAAHLAHVSYAGRKNAAGEFEPRFRITLSSQVDEAMCSKVNLGYLDPNSFVLNDYQNDPDTLIVERAGRDLYLLEPETDAGVEPLEF